MAPLPKRRISSIRRGKRRAVINLKIPTLILCPSCGQPKKPHYICPKCGSYQNNKPTAVDGQPKT